MMKYEKVYIYECSNTTRECFLVNEKKFMSCTCSAIIHINNYTDAYAINEYIHDQLCFWSLLQNEIMCSFALITT